MDDASSACTNCGRKAKKKIESLGFRRLTRIAAPIACRALWPVAVLSTGTMPSVQPKAATRLARVPPVRPAATV
jgi:hypothetical protein